MNFEHILWLFLCFSLLGWVMETTLAAIRTRLYYHSGLRNASTFFINREQSKTPMQAYGASN